VPAAAVKRGGLVLFVMTGRKGYVGGLLKVSLKTEVDLLICLLTGKLEFLRRGLNSLNKGKIC